MMQERCKKYRILIKILDIDESMIPYFGKFGQRLKQRMQMKPIRYDYKVWCLDLKGGYLYDFKVYQGKGSKNEFSDTFGLGPSVVLGLLKSLPKGNFCLYRQLFCLYPTAQTFKNTKYWLYWDSESKHDRRLSFTFKSLLQGNGKRLL